MVEIRNYYIEPGKFEEYKKWAETLAVPHLSTKMEIVGFWVASEAPPIYGGSLSYTEGVTPANVTWVIRWRDMDQRDHSWAELRSSPEWQSIQALLPGGDGSYLRAEARFATELLPAVS
jgi:hypothetical protein